MPLEDSLALELAVCLRDRHGIDRMPQREIANGRQFGADRKPAARNHAADLLGQLPVDRDTGMWL